MLKENRELLIKNELRKAIGYKNYNNWENKRTEYGYHSFNIDEIDIRGQRIPLKRLKRIKKFVNFENKTILDVGCNVGGMIFHLPEIEYGYGLDFDKNIIEAALNIRRILDFNNSDFYVFDFDRDSLEYLDTLIKKDIDIIFLLSIGSWIKNTEKLFDWCIEKESQIVMETNSNKTGNSHLEFFKKRGYEITLISKISNDDISDKNYCRKTFLLKQK